MSDPEKPTDKGDRARRRRWPIVLLVAALAIATAIVWTAVRDHPAETVVKEFFAALHDKDIETALSFTAVVPDGDASAFLVPEAISDDWELIDTDLVGDGHTPDVEAEFAIPGGTTSATYELSRDGDDSWRLLDPLVHVTVPWSPAAYIQANDMIVPVTNLGASGSAVEQKFAFFPGMYDFYPSVPGVAEMEEREPELLFEPGGVTVEFPATSIDPEALPPIQETAHQLMDRCLDQTDLYYMRECPFRHMGTERIEVDGVELWDFENVEWTIERYPEMTIADYPTGAWDDGQQWGFLIESEEAEGAVVYTATGEPYMAEGDPRTVTVECGIDFMVWDLSLVSDGEDVVLDLAQTVSRATFDYTTCADE